MELQELLAQYKSDEESVFNTWFINNDERLRAMIEVRDRVQTVIQDIKTQEFGNDYKGSSLECVLNCITEQKQVFKGASHAFYWKPEKQIPDIYENEENKVAFGQFLENCCNATSEDQIIKEINYLVQYDIKGLGPAVTNILYFLHPEIIPPFNNTMREGFNFLFKGKIKTIKSGSWQDYLRAREVIVEMNSQYANTFSKDLGAFSGFLFHVGRKEKERLKNNKHLERLHKEKNTHTETKSFHPEIDHSIGDDIQSIIEQPNVENTEKSSLIQSRIGQGKFRDSLVNLWCGCAVTRCKQTSLLVASHIKPWSKSDNQERLDPYNGLLLLPNLDKAFDLGFISFEDSGSILISSKFSEYELLGISNSISIQVKEKNKIYLEYHRSHVFKNR